MGGRPQVAIIDATRTAGCGATELGHGSIYETTVGNLPLIGLVCEEIAASGITTARIVTRASARRSLGRTIGGGEAWGLDISYLDVADDGAEDAVLDELGRALGRPVVLHPGDWLLRGGLEVMASRFAAGDVDIVAPEPPETEPAPPSPDGGSRAPLVLGPEVRELVEGLLAAGRSVAQLDAALLESGLRSARCAIDHSWHYSDSTAALLTGNRIVLDAMPGDLDLAERAAGNRLTGRIHIAPSATVSNSVIFGPVSVGEHAVIEDSYLGPFTSVANDVIISGAEIDNTVILAGAELRHPGSRIEASVIGVGASITQSFALPRGMHLRLGAGSRVTFS